ncbi:MAG: STN domain-containing protein [Planctomycetes bacterium]|nr:STN domain-containing protein [Planctomycetota bacterium]
MESKSKSPPEVSSALEPLESRPRTDAATSMRDAGSGESPPSNVPTASIRTPGGTPSTTSDTTELDVRASPSFMRWLSDDDEGESQNGFLKGFLAGLLVAIVVGFLIVLVVHYVPDPKQAAAAAAGETVAPAIQPALASDGGQAEKLATPLVSAANAGTPFPAVSPADARPVERVMPPPAIWELAIRQHLEKRVSFDFVDTPFEDVVSFFNNLTGVNFVLDPEVIEGEDLQVTLRVNDMRLDAALEWTLRLCNLSYVLRNEAILISTKERILKPTVRVYDCREVLKTGAEGEFLQAIQAFIPGEWQGDHVQMQFVDGRLLVRNEAAVLDQLDALMDEFLGKSRRDLEAPSTPPVESPKRR